MSAITGKGPIFDPGLCRCCGVMKKCRILNTEYESSGGKEIYSDMVMDCFGLLLSHLDGKPSERLVCATCVSRLREALTFRRQVLRCEEAFLQMKMFYTDAPADNVMVCESSGECSKLEVEVIKSEPLDADYAAHDDATHDDAVHDDATHYEPVKCESASSRYYDDMPLARRRLRAAPPPSAPAVTRNASNKTPLPMSKVQQLMRERDPSYMTETNILAIVEYSHVCPFKCRHNHLLCYYCGQNFLDPELLRHHTSTEHHPKKFKIFEHRKMIKLDITRIDCRLCPEKIDTLEEFKKHIAGVHEKKYYFNSKDLALPFRLTKDELKCASCEETYPYFHALNKHMNVHYSNYVCETCGLGFVDKARFLMHQQRHDEGDYPCQVCGKVFKAQYNRDLHLDRVHLRRGRVYCPKCDAMLMSYQQKLKHLVDVHGEAPLRFPCKLCDKVLDTRRTLTIHMRKDHLKDYRYDCQYCGQKFFTRFALTNHLPTHTGERNFKCKVCEKTYPRLKTLKDHMKIHTNDRRYRCHICGQAFIQNCSLKGHMKSQHPEYG